MAYSWGTEHGLFGQLLLTLAFTQSCRYQIPSHWGREDKLYHLLMMVQKWLPCGHKLSFLYFTWQEQGTLRHYYLVSSFPALRRPRGHNRLHGGLWEIEDGLGWEDRGSCDEGNKMIGIWWSRGRKCSQGREHETPRGGTVPENMRWWIILVNAFERWKWHFKLVWGNCFVKCYIIYDLDHMRCGFMSITLLWGDETKWKKRSWNSSPSQGASTWCSHWVSLTYKYKENWTQKC